MTIIINHPGQCQELRKSLASHLSIGFVPTMGNLHEGHASLLNRARTENEIVVLSIFINPTQFNNANDLSQYPKTLDEDLELAAKLNIDYVFIPEVQDLYFDNYTYKVIEDDFSHKMEGKHRPGHFTGVLTILLKLFSLIKPNRAYFGEKDFQQLHLVKRMVKSFFLDIDIVSCVTVRDIEGLALSSRNQRLSIEGLVKARKISSILQSSPSIKEIKTQLINAGLIVDYVEKWHDRILSAVTIDGVRLIDNIKVLTEPSLE